MRMFCLGFVVLFLSLPVFAGEVNWGPWTDDLFQRATKEDKLVILDLEAVWCHWCHVMEKETYSSAKVQNLLSSKFIAVKVDQDARPDISRRYEDYGWPATVFFDKSGKELAKRSGFFPPNDMIPLLEKLIKNPAPEEKDEKATVAVDSPYF